MCGMDKYRDDLKINGKKSNRGIVVGYKCLALYKIEICKKYNVSY